MGSSQTSGNPPNLHDLFPSAVEFTPANNNTRHQQGRLSLYQHKSLQKFAFVRNFNFTNTRASSVEQYYYSRAKLQKSPYIFQLIDVNITSTKPDSTWHQLKSNDSSANLCTMGNGLHQQLNPAQKTLWLFVQASTLCLQDEILNRKNKKPFQEFQLWSVLSSSVLGAIILLEHGFKEPVLSPRGIGLSSDGVIKVSEWQIVSRINSNGTVQQGEVFFQKLGHLKFQTSNSLNELLLSYYWAPEGLKAIQKFIALGNKQPQINSAFSHRFFQPDIKGSKYQIFSLGMTLISMCLRNFYYRTDTFSEKYLSKLVHQAIQIRKIEGKQLSKQLRYIIESMVRWDVGQRISYIQLRDLIAGYLSQHGQQMRNSEISLKTYENASQAGHFSHKSTQKNKNSSSSHPSNSYTNSGNTSFLDANSFTLADVEINLVNHSSSGQDQPGSNFTYQGSGMVEQGTGDDDWNLQQEKEELFEENQSDEISSTPVTHRTQKSVRQKQDQIICPSSTPNLALSPKINQDIVKKPTLSRSPYSQISSQQSCSAKPFGLKNNKAYLEEGKGEWAKKSNKSNQKDLSLKISIPVDNFQKIEDSSLNSVTNRRSYRSSNKEPPFIKSARLENPVKTNENSALTLNEWPGEFLNRKELRNEVIIQYKNGSPQPIQELSIDVEDTIDKLLKYDYFSCEPAEGNSEIQTPDIFQTFGLDQQSLGSMHQVPTRIQQGTISDSFSKIHLSPTASHQRKRSSNQDYLQCKNQLKKLSPKQKDYQYMTFNQRPNTSSENQETLEYKLQNQDLAPSKWNKAPRKNNQNNLFTDPKLLEYIKSPIRPIFQPAISQKNQKLKEKDFLMNFQSSEFMGKENLRDGLNKVRQSLEESSVEKSPINLIKDSLQSQEFHNENSYGSKIVKQQVAKGFYQGEKKNGLRSGYGIFYYSEGGKYRGNWLNNKMHGKGTLEYADGRVAYQGEWCCDELHGKGVLYNQSPNFISTSLNYEDLDELDECWIFYEGGFEHDDKSGMGLLVLSNQEQFIGEFRNDMAEGVGQYLRLDGTTVKGIWHKNKLARTIDH